jgi:hypothetical protein
MCALRGRGEPSQDSASAFLKGRILVGVSISSGWLFHQDLTGG